MDSRRGVSRARRNRPMRKSLSRAVAWLLVFCMCMANMNSAAFAAEIASASNAVMAATPSDAVATGSNAMEILMPEETISGEALQEEAVRAISEGNEFKFSSEIKVLKDSEGRDEGYDKLFRGRRSFVLFADNGKGGRIQGDNPNAYGYILVQVDEKEYEAFEKEAGTARATGSNATSSDATGSNASERSWAITGGEELVFLYINADDGSVTFTLNIENLQADDIVVPSYSELKKEREEAKAESEAEEEEENPAAQPAEDGNEAGGNAGSSGGGSGSGSADGGENGDGGQSAGAEEPGSGDGSAAGETSGDENGAGQADGSGEDQENGNGGASGSENGSGENGSADGADQGSGSGSGSGGGQDAEKPDGSGEDQSAGSGDSQDAGDHGNGGEADTGDTGSGSSDKGGSADKGDAGSGSSDKGGNSDKGDAGSGSSDKGGSADKGDAGSGSSDKGGSADKGDAGSGSSDKGGSADKGSSGTAKLSKSSYNVPVVMGPNPDAEFEEDELGDISFDEWQEMMEEAEENEEEEDEDSGDYIEEAAMSYEDGDGTSYLGMSMLPAVTATVKKTEKASGIAKLFRKNRSVEAPALVMAGTVRLSELGGAVIGYHKKIGQNEDGSYRLYLDLAGRSTKGLDIILAVDLSSSMNEKISVGRKSISRLDKVKEVLAGTQKPWGGTGTPGFIETMLNKYEYSRFSIVTFDSVGNTVEINEGRNLTEEQKHWGTKDDLENIKEAVNSLSAEYDDAAETKRGGTNYEAGLWQIKEVLEDREDTKNLPVIVFLTDGKPTFYNAGTPAEGFKYFNGGTNFTDGDEKAGTEITDKTARETIAVAGEFNDWLRKSGNSASIYTIGFELQDLESKDSHMYDLSQYMSAIAQGITWDKGTWRKGGKQWTGYISPETSKRFIRVGKNDSAENTVETLEAAFEKLETYLSLQDISIYDKLSEYVEFAEAPKIKVVERDSGGNEKELSVSINGKDTGTDGDVAFNRNEKSIKLSFNSAFQFKPDCYYELSFDIVPTERTEEISRDEVKIGDPDTDKDPDKIISSEQEGVYTNAEAYFSFGSEGINEVPYQRPVIPAEVFMYKPDHDKYIRDNGDGTYDLTLDVTSGVKSEEGKPEMLPADIVFVLDGSTSMNDPIGYKGDTRKDVVNESIRSLISSLGVQGYDVKYTGIEFPKTDKWADSESAENLLKGEWATANKEGMVDSRLSIVIPDTWGGRGTYPEYGLNLGVKAVNQGSERTGEKGTKKYMILLTDGEPSHTSGIFQRPDIEKALKEAKDELVNLDQSDDITFYAIRCVSDDKGYMQGLVNYVNELDLHNGSEAGKLRTAVSAEDIQEVFEEIENDIYLGMSGGASGVTNVKIEDTLSVYADLVSDVNDIRLTCNKDNALTEDDYRITYDEESKTITVKFTDGYELVQDATYSITFTVKPSERALEDFRKADGYFRDENGAEAEDEYLGDEGTDAPGNDTSSNKPGFPSNESASVTYTYDGRENTLPYKHPVLQVPQSGKFVIQKQVEGEFSGEDPSQEQKFIIEIKEQTKDGLSGFQSSVALTKDGNTSTSPAVIVEGEKTFSIREVVPMEYKQSSIEVYQRDDRGGRGEKAEDRFENGQLTVKPGDDLIVVVKNEPEHKNFFHHSYNVTNKTKGDASDPFDNGLGEEAARTAARLGLTKKKVEFNEEEGGLVA